MAPATAFQLPAYENEVEKYKGDGRDLPHPQRHGWDLE